MEPRDGRRTRLLAVIAATALAIGGEGWWPSPVSACDCVATSLPVTEYLESAEDVFVGQVVGLRIDEPDSEFSGTVVTLRVDGACAPGRDAAALTWRSVWLG